MHKKIKKQNYSSSDQSSASATSSFSQHEDLTLSLSDADFEFQPHSNNPNFDNHFLMQRDIKSHIQSLQTDLPLLSKTVQVGENFIQNDIAEPLNISPDLPTLLPYLSDEKEIFLFLLQNNLVYNGLKCCSNEMDFKIDDQNFHKTFYLCAICSSRKNIFYDSFFFNRSNTPSQLLMCFTFFKQKLSFQSISSLTKINRNQVSTQYYKLIQALSELFSRRTLFQVLGGLYVTVNMDVVKIGNLSYVFLQEQLSGIILIRYLPRSTTSAIKEILNKVILKGSRIVYDHGKVVCRIQENDGFGPDRFLYDYIDRSIKMYKSSTGNNLSRIQVLVKEFRLLVKGMIGECRLLNEANMFSLMKNTKHDHSELMDIALSCFTLPPMGENIRSFREKVLSNATKRLNIHNEVNKEMSSEMLEWRTFRLPFLCEHCVKAEKKKIKRRSRRRRRRMRRNNNEKK